MTAETVGLFINSDMSRRLTGIGLLALMLLFSTATAEETGSGGIANLEDLALQLVESATAQETDDALTAAREAGLSDIQIATAFGLALEALLEIGPRDNLPILMGRFEAFVSESGESPEVVGNALESGQNLARSRAEAGRAMILPTTETRSPRTGLETSPVGGSSARGATGGGGGGVVSGGASPS